MGLEYPFSAFWRALQTTFGWVLLITATMAAGTWLGAWIGLGERPPLGALLGEFGGLFLAWLLFPRILVGFAVTALALYLPLKAERLWLYVSAPVVNLLVWTALMTSVFRATAAWG
jgi:hypothetical protein